MLDYRSCGRPNDGRQETSGSLGALRLSAAAGRLQEAIVRSAVPEAIERDGLVLIDELTAFIEQVRQALTADPG